MGDKEFNKRLKELREKRKDKIEKIQKMVKEQNLILNKIKSVLKKGPKTPVEISKETKIPTHVVMWYVASMKKYGQVAEGDKSGDYYTYLLI